MVDYAPPQETVSARTGALETISYTQRVAGAPRTEGEGISYGKPVEVNLGNIGKLGMPDNVQTYWMDQKGNFSTDSVKAGFSSDFPEAGPMDFLRKFGMDTGERQDMATPKFMMQRVEVGGATQGYFLYNNLPQYGEIGLYVGPDAIDYAGLPKDMKQTLSQPAQNAQATPTPEQQYKPAPAAPQP